MPLLGFITLASSPGGSVHLWVPSSQAASRSSHKPHWRVDPHGSKYMRERERMKCVESFIYFQYPIFILLRDVDRQWD